MAQTSITQLPQAQALTGSESVPIVQGGVTVQTTTGAIAGAGALNYPFLTVGSTVGLTQARYLATSTGLSLTDNGAGSTLQINLTGAVLSLDSSGTGIQVKTGPNTLTGRQIAVGGGMTISDADGVAGDPTIGLNTNLQNLAALSGTGLMTISGSTFGNAVIYGTANQVDVADGNAVGGDPTISLASNPVLPGSGGVQVPSGTSGQRIDTNGVFRYNTTTSRFEGYQGGAWTSMGVGDGTVTSVSGTTSQIAVSSPTTTPVISIVPNPTLPGTGSVVLPQGTTAERSAAAFGALRYNTDTNSLEAYTQSVGWGAIITGTGVTTFSGGSTGLTPNTPTSGGIVLGGILIPANGGTGVNNGSYTITLAGNVSTAGAFTTSGAFPLTLTTTASTNVTLPTTGTLATLAGTETFTNKSISGSTNTLSNIGNSSLTNSSVTYNGVTVALGASGTITASTTNALTVGTGLQLNSGTTFDGSAAKTISIDSSVVTLNGSQTLTNKTLTTPVIAQIVNTGTLTLPTTTDTLVGRDTTDILTNKSISGSSNTLTNIPNSALSNSSITVGTTSISLGGSSLTLGGLTSVAVTQNPTTDYQLATKQYVDNLVATGTTYHDPVYVESPDTAGNLNATYNNGTAGVGATLTNAGTLVALTLDGVLMTVGKRVLIYNQTNQYENGVYTVTTVGSGSVAWVLTRATDADSYGPGPDALDQGSTFFVQAGNTGAGETYTCTTQGTIVFGTTAITFSQIGATQVYSAGTGLTLTNTTFSITNTGVSANTYGSASAVPVFAVNAQGQITSVTNTNIAIGASQVTSGTLAVAQGGTNISSYTIGDLLYASASTTLSKLALGTTNYVLTAGASAPQYVAQSTLSVGSATNATNTAITANSTNATNYLTFVSATTGNLPQLVNSSITCNPSTGQITGGIAGGAF